MSLGVPGKIQAPASKILPIQNFKTPPFFSTSCFFRTPELEFAPTDLWRAQEFDSSHSAGHKLDNLWLFLAKFCRDVSGANISFRMLQDAQ